MEKLARVDEFERFANEMRNKFNRALTKGGPRSERPWATYNEVFLCLRLKQEFKEFLESGDTEELIDVANFCMFIYENRRLGAEE